MRANSIMFVVHFVCICVRESFSMVFKTDRLRERKRENKKVTQCLHWDTTYVRAYFCLLITGHRINKCVDTMTFSSAIDTYVHISSSFTLSRILLLLLLCTLSISMLNDCFFYSLRPVTFCLNKYHSTLIFVSNEKCLLWRTWVRSRRTRIILDIFQILWSEFCFLSIGAYIINSDPVF